MKHGITQSTCDQCGSFDALRSCYLHTDELLIEKRLCEACFRDLGGISTEEDIREAEGELKGLESKARGIEIGMSPNQVKEILGEPHKIDSLDDVAGCYIYIYLRYAFEIKAEFKNDKIIRATMSVV